MRFLLIEVAALEFRAHKVFSRGVVRPLRNIGAIIPEVPGPVGDSHDTEGFVQECLALEAKYGFFKIQNLESPPPGGTWERVLYEEATVKQVDDLVNRLVRKVGAEAWLLVSDDPTRNWGIISSGGAPGVTLGQYRWWTTEDAAALVREFFPAEIGKAPPSPEVRSPLRLNLGCGPSDVHGPGSEWENIDIVGYPGITLTWDLSEGLPYPDESVDEIRATDILEHFSYHIASDILGEWCRVLKPGGFITVRLPDLESLVQAYMEDRENNYLPVVQGLFGRASAHADAHLNAIDFEWLESQLEYWGCPKSLTERVPTQPWDVHSLTVRGVKG